MRSGHRGDTDHSAVTAVPRDTSDTSGIRRSPTAFDGVRRGSTGFDGVHTYGATAGTGLLPVSPPGGASKPFCGFRDRMR
ncbi:hypothetical protein SSCG_04207 [Streptomyces clavuligerus]|nr:hypothetical protein SSCG_04207 [Streptomyces clavuligerus]